MAAWTMMSARNAGSFPARPAHCGESGESEAGPGADERPHSPLHEFGPTSSRRPSGGAPRSPAVPRDQLPGRVRQTMLPPSSHRGGDERRQQT